MLNPSLSVTRRGAMFGAALVIGIAGALWYWGGSSAPASSMPQSQWDRPATVRAVAAQRSDLDIWIRSIGTVLSLNTVTVRSRVDGMLTEVHFKEGAEVGKGDLLAVVDPRPYRARLDQAEGQLQQTQAQLRNARADLAMYEGLTHKNSISQQQLNAQKALVEELTGTLKNHTAQVADARLQVSWTEIKAPIDGRLGLRRVDAGNLVNAGDSDGLVSITQMSPISVQFTVPEVQVGALREAVARGEPLLVDALDRDEQRILAAGQLASLDNQIDTATGTLRAKALFENADKILFPNQFVNVRLRLGRESSVITIPADAVQYGAERTYVYVIADDKAYSRTISLGTVADERVAVTSGLEEGELVVLEGLDRLRDGKAVVFPDGVEG
ncbi:MAG: efflux RND transporter periplasmic adaptor subunit [Porticoccaceae bacterium]